MRTLEFTQWYDMSFYSRNQVVKIEVNNIEELKLKISAFIQLFGIEPKINISSFQPNIKQISFDGESDWEHSMMSDSFNDVKEISIGTKFIKTNNKLKFVIKDIAEMQLLK